MWLGFEGTGVSQRTRSASYSTSHTVDEDNFQARNSTGVQYPDNHNSSSTENTMKWLESLVKEKEAALEKAETQVELLKERVDELNYQLKRSEQACEKLRQQVLIQNDSKQCSDTNQPTESMEPFGRIQMRVDGAGYTGHKQTARVWIGNLYIRWLKVPVDEDNNPHMQQVSVALSTNSPVYMPTVDDVGYQLIAECHLDCLNGPVLATSHTVTIEYDPDMLKVIVSLLKSGRAEFEAFHCKQPSSSTTSTDKVLMSIIVKRRKLKLLDASRNNVRLAEIPYSDLSSWKDIQVTRFMKTKTSDTTSTYQEYVLQSRTGSERNLIIATIREAVKLYFGEPTPSIKKLLEDSEGFLHLEAHKLKAATRKIFHPSEASSGTASPRTGHESEL
eukprot:jgi/Galph1/1219/GphlegSOOS_G6091.1